MGQNCQPLTMIHTRALHQGQCAVMRGATSEQRRSELVKYRDLTVEQPSTYRQTVTLQSGL